MAYSMYITVAFFARVDAGVVRVSSESIIFFYFEFGLRIRRLPPGTYFVRTPRGLPGRGTSEAKPSSELGVVMNLAVPPLAPCQEAHLPMSDTPNRPFC